MSKTEEEYLKKLIKGIDKGNNFVDYFLTIGLDPEAVFNEDLYEASIDEIKNSELFKPVILSKFPPVEKTIINIDETIISCCFPNGYNPIESVVQPKEKVFSLVLDNSYYGIEYPQKYVACLLFYESFERYNKAYTKYKYINDMYNNGNDNSNNLNITTNVIENNSNNIDNTNVNTNVNTHVNTTVCFDDNNYDRKKSNLTINSVTDINSININVSTIGKDIKSSTINSNNSNKTNEVFKLLKNNNDINDDYTINSNQTKANLNKAFNVINTTSKDSSNSTNTIANITQTIQNSNINNKNNNNIKNNNDNNNTNLNTTTSRIFKPTINHNHSNSYQIITNSNKDINTTTTPQNNSNNNINPTHLSSSTINKNSINSNTINTNNKINNEEKPFKISKPTNFPQAKNNLSFLNKTNLNNTNLNNKTRLQDEDRYLRLSLSCIKNKFKNYYAPKLICLVSVHPFLSDYIKILLSIYKFATQNSRIIKPIEKIIDNLIIETPLPPRGLYKVEYKLLNEKLLLTQPKMNELPVATYNFPLIFCLLSTEQIVEIYRYLLLETRIIFFSANIQYLGPTIHSFIQLLFPLKYSFTYISVLPSENINFVESPSPYVIGINQAFTQDFFFNNEDIYEFNFVVVDLDHSKLYKIYANEYKKLSEDKKKQYIKEEFPDFPLHYKQKLSKKLIKDSEALIKSIGLGTYFDEVNSVIGKETNTETTNQKKKMKKEIELTQKLHSSHSLLGTNQLNNVRDHFFQFLVNVFQRYNEFLNLDYYTNNELGQPTIQNLFHVKEFIKIKDSNDYYFYNRLIDTQMFTDFIMKRMVPIDAKDKLEILLFDENLFKKNNRKIFSSKKETPFSNSKAYDYKTTLSVNESTGLSEAEKLKIIPLDKDQEYEIRKKFILLGQDLVIEANNNSNCSFYSSVVNFRTSSVTKNHSTKMLLNSKDVKINPNNFDIYFNYYFFPSLNDEFFFYSNLKEYFIPIVLSEDVDVLNTEIVSKSHLSIVKSLNYEMINNVYICWMQLWAMTFWYQDDIEKKFLFQDLLVVIDKVYYHEIEVFNLIFEVLFKYGLELMILKLFERLIHLKLNPTNSIRMIVMRQLDKEKFNNKNSGNIIKYVKENEYKLIPNENDKFRFRKRSFKMENDLNVLLDEVEFSLEDHCIECLTVINVDECSRDYVGMKKDILWATCPNNNCGSNILPKIKISVGCEVNKNNGFMFNTSINEKLVLYSPAYLKYNYHVGLIKEFYCKLDVKNFKCKFNSLFWNSIWFFSIEELPCYFFIPYQEAIEKSISENYIAEDMENLTITIEKSVSSKKQKTVMDEIDLSLIKNITVSYRNINKGGSFNSSRIVKTNSNRNVYRIANTPNSLGIENINIKDSETSNNYSYLNQINTFRKTTSLDNNEDDNKRITSNNEKFADNENDNSVEPFSLKHSCKSNENNSDNNITSNNNKIHESEYDYIRVNKHNKNKEDIDKMVNPFKSSNDNNDIIDKNIGKIDAFELTNTIIAPSSSFVNKECNFNTAELKPHSLINYNSNNNNTISSASSNQNNIIIKNNICKSKLSSDSSLVNANKNNSNHNQSNTSNITQKDENYYCFKVKSNKSKARNSFNSSNNKINNSVNAFRSSASSNFKEKSKYFISQNQLIRISNTNNSNNNSNFENFSNLSNNNKDYRSSYDNDDLSEEVSSGKIIVPTVEIHNNNITEFKTLFVRSSNSNPGTGSYESISNINNGRNYNRHSTFGLKSYNSFKTSDKTINQLKNKYNTNNDNDNNDDGNNIYNKSTFKKDDYHEKTKDKSNTNTKNNDNLSKTDEIKFFKTSTSFVNCLEEKEEIEPKNNLIIVKNNSTTPSTNTKLVKFEYKASNSISNVNNKVKQLNITKNDTLNNINNNISLLNSNTKLKSTSKNKNITYRVVNSSPLSNNSCINNTRLDETNNYFSSSFLVTENPNDDKGFYNQLKGLNFEAQIKPTLMLSKSSEGSKIFNEINNMSSISEKEVERKSSNITDETSKSYNTNKI